MKILPFDDKGLLYTKPTSVKEHRIMKALDIILAQGSLTSHEYSSLTAVEKNEIQI